MGFINRMLNLGVEQRDITNSDFGIGNLNDQSWSGTRVSESTALNYVPVYACVRLLSESVASLPIDTYRKPVDGSFRQPLANPTWIDSPNAEMTRFEFIERVMSSLCLWGNAYIVKVYDSQFNTYELWPMNPAIISIERSAQTNKLVYVVNGTATLEASEIIHIKGFASPQSSVGLSPIAIHRQAIAAGLSTDEFAARFWSNGAAPSGVIELPAEATQADVDLLSETWNKQHQGKSKAHKTAVITGGGKYTQTSIPPEDAQFLATRQFQVQDIARMYRVPPHMIGDLSNATFSNIEHQGIDFVTHTLRPWLERIELALNSLLPVGQYFKFNEKALLRGDTKSQNEALQIAFQNGWYSTDEIRAILDAAPLPDGLGERFYMPLNFSAINGPEKTMTLTEKINAVGVLVRTGYSPEQALEVVGLDPIEHLGALSLTLWGDKSTDIEANLQNQEELKKLDAELKNKGSN